MCAKKFQKATGEMKKSTLALLVLGSFLCHGDGIDVSTMHTNMLNRLNKSGSTFSVDYTNSLMLYANSTSGTERASALVALGIAMFDHFDTSNDLAALDCCAQICSNVVNDCSTVSNSWQRAMASIVYASTFSQDDKCLQSYSICTNELNRMPQEPIGEDDQQLWSAMCRHQSSCNLSVVDALRFYSALSLLVFDPNSSCAVYTNALPHDAMLKIRAVLE